LSILTKKMGSNGKYCHFRELKCNPNERLKIMKLIEVNKKNFRSFHDVARYLYRSDPNWIAPLDMEVENIFTPGKNRLLEEGECIRWILVGDHGEFAGRIAAFIDHRKNRQARLKVGGLGFLNALIIKSMQVCCLTRLLPG